MKRPKNYDAHHRSGQSLGPPGWDGWMGTRYLYYPVSVQLCIQCTQVGRYLVGHITYKYIESRHFFHLPKSSHSKEDVERCYAQICMTCYYLLIHKHKKQTFADDVMLGIRMLFETLKNVYVAGKIYLQFTL